MSRSHHKGGEPSQRMLRVAELIRHAAAELLTRGAVDDPVLASHVVTVPSVKMSPDLKLATISVMINMKFAPEIRFRIDESFENAAKIDALLARPEVRRDVDKDEAETGGEA
jgi:ribosome-binding factor A